MDSSRMETLLQHTERMSSDLTDMLDRFKMFTEKERPQVAVVCSEKLLFSEMAQLFTGIDDMDVNVYGAYDGADILYDVMLSDAVIAVTSALRIAPVGLCGLLTGLEKISKEIYFLVGGWGSISRNKEQAESKSRKVTESFLGSYIHSITSIYKSPCDGFMLPGDAASELLKTIANDAARLRTNQEERLYSMLKTQVAAFYDIQQALYDNQATSVLNAKRLVQVKSGEYSVRLSHLTVDIQNVIDKLMMRVSQISAADIEYSNDPDETEGSLATLFEQNPKTAEQTAKDRAAALITKAFNEVKVEQADTVSDSGEALEADCKGDMLAMVNRLKANGDISEDYIAQIEAAAANTQSVHEAVAGCCRLTERVINSVNEKTSPTIGSYRFTLKPGANDKLVKMGKRLLEELGEGDGSEEKFSVKTSDAQTDYSQKHYDYFIQDVKNMLADAYAKLLNLLQDRTTEIKRDIEEKSRIKLVGYFTAIDKLLGDVAADLDKQKSSFSLE